MKPEAQRKVRHYHISGKDRAYFTSNLALLMKAAVPVGEALESLQETAHSSGFKKAIEQMRQDIDDGLSLHQAIQRSGIASRQTLTMIEFGEKSGYLVENLQAAAKQEEKQRTFRANIRSALFYPTFVLVLTFVIGLSIAWFLLPRLAETFTKLDIPLPWISQVFIAFGVFLRSNGIWFVPLMIAAFFLLGYILFYARPTRVIGQKILFYTPGIGKLIREVEIARLGYLLSTLLRAGLTITQSIQLLQNSTDHQDFQKLYAHLYASFDEGYTMKASLASYKPARRLLPATVQQIIITGERTGSLAESLESVGSIYEEKVEVSTKTLESALEPILLVVIAAGVLAVAVGVILPLYSLVGGLN